MLIMSLMRHIFWKCGNWLERLTGHQRVEGSIPVWDSEIVLPRIELDEPSSIIQLQSVLAKCNVCE